MLSSRPTSLQVEDPTFSALFEQSRVPMALVDRDRRYVDINDAGLELFSYRREDVIGQLAGRTGVNDEGADQQWRRLLRTNELYGERTVLHPSGTPMRVGYAAHATTVNGQWLALVTTLSAHFEPDGVELVGTTPRVGTRRAEEHRPAAALTAREREVVRRVALGASTRQIAADLYLSPATVRSHVRNAMVKTKSHTRAQLVALVLADVQNPT
jgi:PAS domain S-box-containing protein